MTDNVKLLCTLLSETEDDARTGTPEMISPLRMVSILHGRQAIDEVAV
jgi:hypothetical protein